MAINYSFLPFRVDIFNAGGGLQQSIIEDGSGTADNLIDSAGLTFEASGGLEQGVRYQESCSFAIASYTDPVDIGRLDSFANPNVFRRGNRVQLYVGNGSGGFNLFATLYMSTFVNNDGKQESKQGEASLGVPSITVNCVDLFTLNSSGPSGPDDDSGVVLGVASDVTDVIEAKLRKFLKDDTFSLATGETFSHTVNVPIIQSGEGSASVPTTVHDILNANPNNQFRPLYLNFRPNGDVHIAEADFDPSGFLLDEDLATSDLIKDALVQGGETQKIPGRIIVTATLQSAVQKPLMETYAPPPQRGPISLPAILGPNEDYDVVLDNPTSLPIKKITSREVTRTFGGPNNAYVTGLLIVDRFQEPDGYIFSASKGSDQLLSDLDDTIQARVTGLQPSPSDEKRTSVLWDTTFVGTGDSGPPALTRQIVQFRVPRAKIDPPLEASEIFGSRDLTTATFTTTEPEYTSDQKISREVRLSQVSKGWNARQGGTELDENDDPTTLIDQSLAIETWDTDPNSGDYVHDLEVTEYLNQSLSPAGEVPADNQSPPATNFAESAYKLNQAAYSCGFEFTDQTGNVSPLEQTLTLGTNLLDPTLCSRVAENHAMLWTGQNGEKVFNVAIDAALIALLRPTSGNPRRNMQVLDDVDLLEREYIIESYSINLSRVSALASFSCLQLGYSIGTSPISLPTTPTDGSTLPGTTNIVAGATRQPSLLLNSDNDFILTSSGGGIAINV